jgi:MFS family permease
LTLDEDDSSIKDEIQMLLDNLTKFQANLSGKKKSKWRQLRKPILYKPLGIMITFFAFQQFSGIFVIMVYAAKFSTEAGVAINPFLCTVFIGLTRVVTTLVMGFISDKFGRKPPAYFSGFGMAMCMFGLSVCAKYPTKGTSLDWMPMFLIIAFMVSCTLGFLTLPFAMIAEMFPQKLRGFAAGLTIFAAYSMSFVTIKLYPGMVEHLGNICVFAMYGCVSLCGILFVYFILPETKGKSLEEIEDYFRGSKKNKKSKTVENGELELQDK